MQQEQISYWPDTRQLTKPAKAVAEMLGVHPNTLFRWIKAGKIQCVRFSKHSVHFTYDQVVNYLNQNSTQNCSQQESNGIFTEN